MSTKIRLKRIGRRNRPFYRVIVIDSRKRRDGAAIEELGWYNPIEADNSYKLNEERIYYWLERGAQVSDTVHSLLQKAGIAFKWHLMRQGLDEKKVEKELQKWHLKQAEKAKQETKVETKEKKGKEKAEQEEASQVMATLDAEPKKIEEQVIETEKTSEEPPKAVENASAEVTPADDDIQNSAAEEKAEEKQQAGEG